MPYTEKFSEEHDLLDVVNPVSSSTQVDGLWVDVGLYSRFVAKFNVGLIAATGTLTFQIRQATSAAGANAKAFKVADDLIDSDDNLQRWIECRNEELDVDGGFHFVRIEAVADTAASLISMELLGFVNRYGPVVQPVTLVVS